MDELNERVSADAELSGVEDIADVAAPDEFLDQRRLADPAPTAQQQAPPSTTAADGRTDLGGLGSEHAKLAPPPDEISHRSVACLILSPTILSLEILSRVEVLSLRCGR